MIGPTIVRLIAKSTNTTPAQRTERCLGATVGTTQLLRQMTALQIVVHLALGLMT